MFVDLFIVSKDINGIKCFCKCSIPGIDFNSVITENGAIPLASSQLKELSWINQIITFIIRDFPISGPSVTAPGYF